MRSAGKVDGFPARIPLSGRACRAFVYLDEYVMIFTQICCIVKHVLHVVARISTLTQTPHLLARCGTIKHLLFIVAPHAPHAALARGPPCHLKSELPLEMQRGERSLKTLSSYAFPFFNLIALPNRRPTKLGKAEIQKWPKNIIARTPCLCSSMSTTAPRN